MRSFVLVFTLLLFTHFVYAQSVHGKVVDGESGEGLPYANVVLEQGKVQVAGTTTDLDGNYILTGFSAGVYTARAIYVGYDEQFIEKVIVKDKQVTSLDFEMKTGLGNSFGCGYVVVPYKVPLIDFESFSSGSIYTSEEISRFVRSADL